MSRRPGLTRRAFLGRSALALCGAGVAALAAPARAPGSRPGGWPASDDDEPGPEVRRVLRGLFGDRTIRKGHVELDLPAEPPDGRVIPVFVESDLPMDPEHYVRAVHLLVDKNPDIHLATFHLSPAIGRASVDTRIKMRATSWVRAIVETSRGELWTKAVKAWPATNGCG